MNLHPFIFYNILKYDSKFILFVDNFLVLKAFSPNIRITNNIASYMCVHVHFYGLEIVELRMYNLDPGELHNENKNIVYCTLCPNLNQNLFKFQKDFIL